MANQKPIRGFLFACTDKSEYESLSGLLFATEGFYGPIVIRIRKGDLIFLNNINTDKLFGVFKTITNGGINLRPKAFNGKYPYQVEVKPVGDIIEKTGAKKLLGKHAIKRNRPLIGTNLIKFLEDFVSTDKLATNQESNKQNKSILRQIDILRKGNMEIDIEDEIPLIESTTFWDFPKQSYGLTPKGDNKYAGVTPALIIYNLIWRYTRPKIKGYAKKIKQENPTFYGLEVLTQGEAQRDEVIMRKLAIKYGDFLLLPDIDSVIVWNDTKHRWESEILAIISCKTSLRERIAQACYWKLKLLSSDVQKGIRVFLATADNDDDFSIGDSGERFNGKSRDRVISEHELDGIYILRVDFKVDWESTKVKRFERIFDDILNIIKQRPRL